MAQTVLTNGNRLTRIVHRVDSMERKFGSVPEYYPPKLLREHSKLLDSYIDRIHIEANNQRDNEQKRTAQLILNLLGLIEYANWADGNDDLPSQATLNAESEPFEHDEWTRDGFIEWDSSGHYSPLIQAMDEYIDADREGRPCDAAAEELLFNTGLLSNIG